MKGLQSTDNEHTTKMFRMLKALKGMRFDPTALLLSFILANLASGVIKTETAILMFVPTMLILMQARVTTCEFTMLTYFVTCVTLFYYYTDAFYVLIIYSVFYFALVMKVQVEKSLVVDSKKR